jgi:hypothetical protein
MNRIKVLPHKITRKMLLGLMKQRVSKEKALLSIRIGLDMGLSLHDMYFMTLAGR